MARYKNGRFKCQFQIRATLAQSPQDNISFHRNLHFQDYDPLRSGSITVSQFRRGLSDFGLSALGQHHLSNSQFEMLAACYADPAAKDKVRWVDFMADVESGK